VCHIVQYLYTIQPIFFPIQNGSRMKYFILLYRLYYKADTYILFYTYWMSRDLDFFRNVFSLCLYFEEFKIFENVFVIVVPTYIYYILFKIYQNIKL